LLDVLLGQVELQCREQDAVVVILELLLHLLDARADGAEFLLGLEQVLHPAVGSLAQLDQPLLHRLGRAELALRGQVLLGHLLGCDALALQVAEAAQLEHEAIQVLRRQARGDAAAHLAVCQLLGLAAGDEPALFLHHRGDSIERALEVFHLEFHLAVTNDLATGGIGVVDWFDGGLG
jgi:hypothetical protein